MPISNIKILRNYPMSKLSTFKIGGPAKEVYLPTSAGELAGLVSHFNKEGEKFLILGNGSNILVGDEGINFPIIQIKDLIRKYSVDRNGSIIAEAGILLGDLSRIAADAELSGIEFASGIPGTLGGSIYMNAGAYGGEIKDIVEYVDVVNQSGEHMRMSKEELKFSYRHSSVKMNGWIVVGAKINLNPGRKSEILEKIDDLTERRNSKQPLDYPSAGSIFKRPEGHYASKLIDDSGLRGHKVGGAQVSEKHCGFIVNTGGATSADVFALVEYIQKKVKEETGITLERELRLFGE